MAPSKKEASLQPGPGDRYYRFSRWKQTGNLEDALDMHLFQIGTGARRYLQTTLDKMSPEQAADLLNSISDQLQDRAVSSSPTEDQFNDALQTASQTALAPKTGDAAQPSATETLTGPSKPPVYYFQPQLGQFVAGAQASNDPAYLAAFLGVGPDQVDAGYQHYLQQFKSGATRSGEDTKPLDKNSWVQSQLTVLEGAYQPVLDSYEFKYEQQYGQPMPPDLRAQLRNAIQHLTPSQKATLDQQLVQVATQAKQAGKTITDPTLEAQMSFNVAALNQVVGSYVPLPTQTSEQQATQKNLTDLYYSMTGQMPDASMLAKLTAMGYTAAQDYIYNDIPYQGTKSYNDYTRAQKELLDTYKWHDLYGQDPTASDIAWASHATADDIQHRIDNSQSAVSGMRMADYQAFKSFADPIYQKHFGTPAPDALLADLHGGYGR